MFKLQVERLESLNLVVLDRLLLLLLPTLLDLYV